MTSLIKIFQSFEGNWNFHRTISNYGNIIGSATFKRSATENNLLHYREEGELKRENGEPLRVYREYLYRYQDDRISVFFAEETERLFHILEFQDIPESVENFTFDKASAPGLQQTKSVSKQPMCEHMGDADGCKDGDAGSVKNEVFNRFRYTTIATARHLCSCDVYDATYEFTSLDEFKLAYRVMGPNKNYLMTTVFKRYLGSV